MDSRLLESMYQQWRQGNNDYQNRWTDFVLLAAKEFNAEPKEVMDILQKKWWFEWRV